MASENETILNSRKNMPSRADHSMSTPNWNEKPNQEERKRFWEAFRACSEENRVSPDRSRYYVRWAKDFVDFLPEKRLKARSGEDIKSFLASLSQREGIVDWQVRQAEHALRILYEVFLPSYSPEKPTPTEPANRHGTPRVERKETTDFRDRVLPGEVERHFSAQVERFRTEMRTRHYSYRTEMSYLAWMRRFIAFHDYANPESLDPTVAVKEYLEFLALKREVSASTQNQLLTLWSFYTGKSLK